MRTSLKTLLRFGLLAAVTLAASACVVDPGYGYYGGPSAVVVAPGPVYYGGGYYHGYYHGGPHYGYGYHHW